MDDPVISCLSYVVKKTCITFGKLLQFLGLRLLDIIGLVFNVLAFCTIIRIPGLISTLVCSHQKFKWKWKYAGIVQLLIFILDIPLLISLPFFILCPWRIYRVYAGAVKHKEFEKFSWEGWDIRRRIWKHFIFLLFDILSIPFTICLALSWRCVRCYNLFSSCDKKEKTIKFIIVCQFLHLICDILAIPFIFLLMVSWRSPLVFTKFVGIYFAKKDLPDQNPGQQEHVDLQPEEQNEAVPQLEATEEALKPENPESVRLANEVELEFRYMLVYQSFNLILDLLSLPAMIVTIFSWRIMFFILSCKKRFGCDRTMSMNKRYAFIRRKLWQNMVYFFIDLPCIFSFLLLVAFFPILPWRLTQYLTGLKSRLFGPRDKGVSENEQSNTSLRSSKHRQMHERKLLMVACVIIACDILSICAAIIVACTIWRLPFLIHELKRLHKKPLIADQGSIVKQFALRKSGSIWKVCVTNCFLFFADLMCGVIALLILGTLWRAYPLFSSMKGILLTASSKNDESPETNQVSEKATIFTVKGMKIRRTILKHFGLLIIDIPAIILSLIHIVFVIKVPAIISVILGGNFYLEFAMTVYIETAKLLADLVFLCIFIFMCFVRPIAIWVHILEDKKHRKYRLSAEWLVHVKWLMKQRDKVVSEAESMLSLLIKNSQRSDLSENMLTLSEQHFVEVSVAKGISQYTKKLDKVKNIMYEEELDDKLLYHIGLVVFFENKLAHHIGRRFVAERMFLANPSIVAHRRNLDLIQKEEALFEVRRQNAIELLKKFDFEQIPLWEGTVGFRERSRKETQKAIISAVTSGNFVTFLLCLLNTLLVYRAPSMFLSIYHAVHQRRKIALKTLKNYALDLVMFAKILLICLSIYKVPDLISALVVSLVHKRSMKAARNAVDSIPGEMLKDLCNALKIILSWKTIAYTFSSLLFLIFMPLSVMVKIQNAMYHNPPVAYAFGSIPYIAVIVLPFVISLILPAKIGVSITMSGVVGGFMILLVMILIVFILLQLKSSNQRTVEVKNIDYVRINWFNIHAYCKLLIEFLQLIALIFTVKMSHLKYREHFHTASKYILLDVYEPIIKFSLACAVFVMWFFIASVPIILEGILKYVEKGTFSNNHFTWRAFLSFFGGTLFMVIPEVGLSFLACEYTVDQITNTTHATLIDDPTIECWTGSHNVYAVLSLFGMMWYLLTSNLICLTFSDSMNQKIDIQFSPAYSAIENIFKVLIVTIMTLFRESIYSLVASTVLIFAMILVTCLWGVFTGFRVANYFRLTVLKIGSLAVVACCALTVIVVEMLKITGPQAVHALAGIFVILIIATVVASISRWALVQSEQEIARKDFKKLLPKIIGKLKSIDALLETWKSVQFAYSRMLRHVRVAHPKDKMFNNEQIAEIDGTATEAGPPAQLEPPLYQSLIPKDQAKPDTSTHMSSFGKLRDERVAEIDGTATETAPPAANEALVSSGDGLTALPEPPSYESLLSEEQAKLQADEYFVPDASIYLSPFGDWMPYDATKILEEHGWMVAHLSDSVLELTDAQCNGSELLLLLEQHIKYTAHSYEFVKDIGNWRKAVRESTWTGLLHYAKKLSESIQSSFEKPENYVLSYDPEKDLIPPNPDQSTFPMYFELTDVTSLKMGIHSRELGKLLMIIPEPWKSVFTKIIPSNEPLIKRVRDCDSEPSPSRFSVDMFKQASITINDVAAGGFKIARGAKILLPKTLNIINISSTNIAFSKPYLSGSKGPISKSVDSLNAAKIGEEWYVVVGKNRAKVSKILATLDDLQFSF